MVKCRKCSHGYHHSRACQHEWRGISLQGPINPICNLAHGSLALLCENREIAAKGQVINYWDGGLQHGKIAGPKLVAASKLRQGTTCCTPSLIERVESCCKAKTSGAVVKTTSQLLLPPPPSAFLWNLCCILSMGPSINSISYIRIFCGLPYPPPLLHTVHILTTPPPPLAYIQPRI